MISVCVGWGWGLLCAAVLFLVCKMYKKRMQDPFEPDSVFKGKELRNRKILLFIFVPLLIVLVLSGVAVYMASLALQRSYVHPECACRKILEEVPSAATQKPIFAVVNAPPTTV